jgi:hypothetical protein
MLNIESERKTSAPDSSLVSRGEVTTSVSPPDTRPGLIRRLWRTVKRYPIPAGLVALLIGSLALWLAGCGDLAKWALLVTVLLGGIPRLWETVQQFLRKELSVDMIVILNALRAGRIKF